MPATLRLKLRRSDEFTLESYGPDVHRALDRLIGGRGDTKGHGETRLGRTRAPVARDVTRSTHLRHQLTGRRSFWSSSHAFCGAQSSAIALASSRPSPARALALVPSSRDAQHGLKPLPGPALPQLTSYETESCSRQPSSTVRNRIWFPFPPKG
jgi:hypothetical protein